MFHAHQSEFAELGWMGLFEAAERAVTPETLDRTRPVHADRSGSLPSCSAAPARRC